MQNIEPVYEGKSYPLSLFFFFLLGLLVIQTSDLPSGKTFTTTGSSTQKEFTAIQDPIPNKATKMCVIAA